MKRKTILFVGMSNSPHAAKWIQLLTDQGWDLHFFPIDLVRPHPLLRDITLHQPWKRIYPRQWILTQWAKLFGGAAARRRCW